MALINHLSEIPAVAIKMAVGQPSDKRIVIVNDYNAKQEPIAATYRYINNEWVCVETGTIKQTSHFTPHALWMETLLKQPGERRRYARNQIASDPL